MEFLEFGTCPGENVAIQDLTLPHPAKNVAMQDLTQIMPRKIKGFSGVRGLS